MSIHYAQCCGCTDHCADVTRPVRLSHQRGKVVPSKAKGPAFSVTVRWSDGYVRWVEVLTGLGGAVRLCYPIPPFVDLSFTFYQIYL